MSALWEYIKGKISSILGLTKDSYGGKAATAGTADSAKAVAWGNVSGKPASFNPAISRQTMTLSASKWSGSAAPYTYDLGITGKTVVIGFNSATGTAAQLTAIQKANVQGGDGSKIYAYGTKPTVDIPIVVSSI